MKTLVVVFLFWLVLSIGLYNWLSPEDFWEKLVMLLLEGFLTMLAIGAYFTYK